MLLDCVTDSVLTSASSLLVPTDELRRMLLGGVRVQDLIQTRITLIGIQELVEGVLCHLSLRLVGFSLPGGKINIHTD